MSEPVVDVWAIRNAMWPAMSNEARRAYVAGVTHAFGDVFEIFGDVFARPISPTDINGAFEKIGARFAQYLDDFDVKGVL